MEAMISVYRI